MQYVNNVYNFYAIDFPGWGPCSKLLMKIPIQTNWPMKIPRQYIIAYDPDLISFKFLGAFMCSLKTTDEKTKMRYDTDFGFFNLWKDSKRSNKFSDFGSLN